MNDIKTPLVLDFHGYTGDSSSQEFYGGLDDVSDEDADAHYNPIINVSFQWLGLVFYKIYVDSFN